MRTPESLVGLADYGLVDEVIRPLMSGKEAQIYLVWSEGEVRVAKVYREAEHRNFKHRAEYTEGRNTRNSRDRRARTKRTSYGRSQDEAAWRSAEVDMIYRLNDAGVRVPRPYHFVDGVLIMELVRGADGEPAPRLGDLSLGADDAAKVYERLLREVIRMLAAGVVHGDLSDFNVLMDGEGPVIIDLPQAVDASANTNARKLLLRDVENLHNFARRSMPGLRPRPYAQEMWELYQRGELTADSELRGQFKAANKRVDTDDVLGLIREADDDEQRRRDAKGLAPIARPRRVEVAIAPANNARRGGTAGGGGGATSSRGSNGSNGSNGQGRTRKRTRDRAPDPPRPSPEPPRKRNDGGSTRRRPEPAAGSAPTGPAHAQQGAAPAEDGPRRKRRRRRRGGGTGAVPATASQQSQQSQQSQRSPQSPPSQQAARGADPQPRRQGAPGAATERPANVPTAATSIHGSTDDAQSAPRKRRRRRRRPAAPPSTAP